MPVYLDHNATTPLAEPVFEAMQPFLQGVYGNPSSVHRMGRMCRDALETARVQLANACGAQANQVVFTSGGTEANNLAIRGLLAGLQEESGARRFAISRIEHASLMQPALSMARQQGWQLDWIGVNPQGQVQARQLQEQLFSNTRLVSVMAANNETGALQDIKQLVAIVRATNPSCWMHSDACQLLGKQALNFSELGLDAMSVSSHKLYGPQGAGALIIDRKLDLQPLIQGGGQEKGRRSGTENLPAIVGFGVAAELAQRRLGQRQQLYKALQSQLLQQLMQIEGISIFSEQVPRLDNTVQFSMRGIDGEALLMQLDRKGFAVSSGSACDSGRTEPSHVLSAMGVTAQRAKGAIRVSFGEQNTPEQVSDFVLALKHIKQQFN